MKQNHNYVIIGNGRMAKHFCHYLTLSNIPFTQWDRQTNTQPELNNLISTNSHFLLLIKDSAIEEFINEHNTLKEKNLIHFSGCLKTDLAFGMHPLCTFNNDLYTLEEYKNIAFITEDGKPRFNEFFPDLSNPSFILPANQNNLYHALCVLSGNFTTILWQKCFEEFETKFNIPKSAVIPYLQKTVENVAKNPKTALTGPLVRGDKSTIENNLKSLKNDPFQEIYKAFVKVYKATKV